MKHIFIVNPTSGNGQYLDIIKSIREVFAGRSDYEIIMTEYQGHAKEISSRFDKGHRIYAVGGDGTAHEILNGLQDGVPLGLIPAGTGNDFLRNFTPKVDLANIIVNIINGDTVAIDYAMFNDHKQLNCVNIGLDADINQEVNKSKITLFPRKSLYLLFALKCLFFKRTVQVVVEHDGQRHTHDVLLATFMNGQYYGGGFHSAPTANLQDGLLDVTLVTNVSRLRILRLLPIYYKGKHIGVDVVTNYQTSEVFVKSDTPIRVGCDGELSEMSEFRIKVVPAGLNLILPVGSSIKGNAV